MNVLIPLPPTDFDPTEVSIPWKIMRREGVAITFATPKGEIASADSRMITGEGLGLWKDLLRADATARSAYKELEAAEEFQNPIRWDQIQTSNFDGILLPGGHAPGMKVFLESKSLQARIAEFFAEDKIVGAICHGLLLVARSTDSRGRSVLADRRTTALWRQQELLAWILTKSRLGNYYRTYPETVQDEVLRVLNNKENFIPGSLPLLRDSETNPQRGFVVEDRNYISARWPGDAHRLGYAITRKLKDIHRNSRKTSFK